MEPDFVRHQRAFTAHVRDPSANPVPSDVEDRRMGIYRELLYNNVESFMANSFPVIRKLHGDEAWHALIRDYFARHRAHTPLFTQMPQEFVRYLEAERSGHPEDPPFLRELAHYEWVELALSTDARELDFTAVDTDGDLLLGVPVLSPLAWPLAYRCPVHRIGPDFRPEEPPAQPTYIVVNRDRDHRVRFLELNPVTARMLDLLSTDEPPTGEAALRQIARELGHPSPDTVIRGGLEALQMLRDRDIVIGVSRTHQ
jgi:hypothetical protein